MLISILKTNASVNNLVTNPMYVKNYYYETTLLGFKYFVAGKRSEIEKFVNLCLNINKKLNFLSRALWVIALFVSAVICGLLMRTLLKNVNRNPIVSYRSNIPVEVSSIPFSAVTYLPDIKTVFGDFHYEETLTALRSGNQGGNISINDIKVDE